MFWLSTHLSEDSGAAVLTFSESILVYLRVLNHLSVSSFAARAMEQTKERFCKGATRRSEPLQVLEFGCEIHALAEVLTER